MKTFLRILTILLIGTLVSGGIYLIVQNTTTGSDMGDAPSFDQMPTMSDDEMIQPPARPDGGSDHHSASLERGFSEVGISLAKLTGITVVVLLIRTLAARLHKRHVVGSALG